MPTSNRTRRSDIAAALKRAKPGDVLTLEQLAILWGVTKPRFVSVRNTMADFPQPLPGRGNEYVYPARKALEAMLKHETRHDDAQQARAARANAILGRGKRRGVQVGDAGAHTPNELATLNRIAAETEERERQQGFYIPVAEVAMIAGDVFSEFSETIRGLSNKIDPNGLLQPEERLAIDEEGKSLLLRLHKKMKDMLSPDARPRGNRTAAGRSRGASARR